MLKKENIKKIISGLTICAMALCSITLSASASITPTSKLINCNFSDGSTYVNQIFSGNNAIKLYQVIAAGEGNKDENDKYVAITPSNSNVRMTMKDISKTDISSQTGVMVLSFDVYAGSGFKTAVFQGSSSTDLTNEVALSDLNADSWNNITFTFTYESTGVRRGDIYINGEFVDRSLRTVYSSPFTQYRLVLNKTEASTDVIYMDNLKLYDVPEFAKPTLSSSVYSVGNGIISGCVGKTVLETKSNVTASDSADIKVVDTADAVVVDADVIVPGMSVIAELKLDDIVLEEKYSVSSINKLINCDFSTGSNYASQIFGENNAISSYSIVNGSIGNKAENDAYVSITPSNSNVRMIMKDKSKTNISSQTGVMVLSFDVYAGSGFKTAVFQGSSSTDLTNEVALSDLNSDSWNNITFAFYYDSSSTRHGDIYINGKYKETGKVTVYSAAYTQYRLVFNNSVVATEPIYMDNVKLYDVAEFVKPSLSSNNLSIENSTISVMNGYTDENVRNQVTPSSGSTVEIPAGVITESTTAKAVLHLDDMCEFYEEYNFSLAPYLLLASANQDSFSNLKDTYGFESITKDTSAIGGIKMVGNRNEARFRIHNGSDYQINYSSAANELVYGFEIYPNDAIKTIGFKSTQNKTYSFDVKGTDFIQHQWNKVVMVFSHSDSSTWLSDIYINGVLKYNNYTNQNDSFADQIRLYITLNDYNTNNTFYMNNIAVADVLEFVAPEITSDVALVREMHIIDGRVDGFGGLSIKQIADSLGSNSNVSFTLYNEDGTVADVNSAKEATQNMYIVATTNYTDVSEYGFYSNNYSYKYVLIVPYYEAGKFVCSIDGEERTDNTYSAGLMSIKIPIYNYKTSFEPWLILAEFEPTGKEIIDVQMVKKNITTSSDILEITSTIEENTDSIFKAFLWDSNLCPYAVPLELEAAK